MTTTKPRDLTPAEGAIVGHFGTWMRSWNASERTVRAREQFLAARLRSWGLAGFTEQACVDFLGGLRAEDRTGWTISTYYGHLRAIGEWLATAGHLPSDPMAEVRKPIQPKSEPRPLSDADVDRVLSVVTGDVRDWIVLVLHTGLRVHEVAKLHGSDVDTRGVRVRGKGGSIHTLPCHPEVWAMAQRYPRDGYWWPGSDRGHIFSQRISAKVGSIFTGMGIEGSIHRVRHTYGTRLLRQGVNIRRVQKLMRHASLATTAAYTAVDEDELRDAVLMLPPMTEPTPESAA